MVTWWFPNRINMLKGFYRGRFSIYWWKIVSIGFRVLFAVTLRRNLNSRLFCMFFKNRLGDLNQILPKSTLKCSFYLSYFWNSLTKKPINCNFFSIWYFWMSLLSVGITPQSVFGGLSQKLFDWFLLKFGKTLLKVFWLSGILFQVIIQKNRLAVLEKSNKLSL